MSGENVDITVQADDVDFQWNDEQETNVKEWGQTSISYAVMHNKAGQYYQTWHKRLGIPVILSSTVAAFVQLSTISPNSCSGNEIWVNILAGILTMAVAALSSIQTFYGLQERYQQHFSATTAYDMLHMEIKEQLAYERARRYNVRSFIRYIKQTLKTLKKVAPDIPVHIQEAYIRDIDSVLEHKPLQVNDGKKISDVKNDDAKNDDVVDWQDEFTLELKRRREEKQQKEITYYLQSVETQK